MGGKGRRLETEPERLDDAVFVERFTLCRRTGNGFGKESDLTPCLRDTLHLERPLILEKIARFLVPVPDQPCGKKNLAVFHWAWTPKKLGNNLGTISRENHAKAPNCVQVKRRRINKIHDLSYFDTVEVIGSIPVAPTIFSIVCKYPQEVTVVGLEWFQTRDPPPSLSSKAASWERHCQLGCGQQARWLSEANEAIIYEKLSPAQDLPTRVAPARDRAEYPDQPACA
jgi:hypothetical protein